MKNTEYLALALFFVLTLGLVTGAAAQGWDSGTADNDDGGSSYDSGSDGSSSGDTGSDSGSSDTSDSTSSDTNSTGSWDNQTADNNDGDTSSGGSTNDSTSSSSDWDNQTADNNDTSWDNDTADNNDGSWNSSTADNDDGGSTDNQTEWDNQTADNNDGAWDNQTADNNDTTWNNETADNNDGSTNETSGDDDTTAGGGGGDDEGKDEKDDDDKKDDGEDKKKDDGADEKADDVDINVALDESEESLLLDLSEKRIQIGQSINVKGRLVTQNASWKEVTVLLNNRAITKIQTDEHGNFSYMLGPENVGSHMVKVRSRGLENQTKLEVTPTVDIASITTSSNIGPGEEISVCPEVLSQVNAQVTLLHNGQVIDSKKGRNQVCFDTTLDQGENRLRAVAEVEGDRDEREIFRNAYPQNDGEAPPATGGFTLSSTAARIAALLLGLLATLGLLYRNRYGKETG